MHTPFSYRYLALGLTWLGLGISGCSTMSRNECVALDWRTIGYEDGVAGHSGDRIAQHRKACAKHGVRADLAQYQEGREQGLREHCQPANGYQLGLRGEAYRGICPADLEQDFLASYEAGHELYTLRARVWNAEAQLSAKRRELDRIQHGIVANSAAVLDDESHKADRADALLDTATLAERAGRLKEEIRRLEADRARFERDLEDYQASR